jgi:hypothetical protein
LTKSLPQLMGLDKKCGALYSDSRPAGLMVILCLQIFQISVVIFVPVTSESALIGGAGCTYISGLSRAKNLSQDNIINSQYHKAHVHSRGHFISLYVRRYFISRNTLYHWMYLFLGHTFAPSLLTRRPSVALLLHGGPQQQTASCRVAKSESRLLFHRETEK